MGGGAHAVLERLVLLRIFRLPCSNHNCKVNFTGGMFQDLKKTINHNTINRFDSTTNLNHNMNHECLCKNIPIRTKIGYL